LFTFIHAANYKSMLFYRGSAPVGSAIELRTLEASQAGGLLMGFYLFLLLMLFALAFALGATGQGGRKARTTAPPSLAYGGLAVALLVGLFIVFQVNVRPMQADMIFKRAKPHDDLATRSTQAELQVRLDAWDTAIAIYNLAIERNPTEDFYYLFLGRAYLERAALTQNAAEQA